MAARAVVTRAMAEGMASDWDASAADYARHSRHIGWYAQSLTSLLKGLPDHPRCLVDFGCGDGRLARRCLQLRRDGQPLRLYLVDRSPAMLDLTQDLGGPGVTVERLCDDESLAAFLQAEEGCVDAIVSGHCFHLLRDDALALTGWRLVERAAALLGGAGCLAVNIPDQAWVFEDGWTSAIYATACRLWGPSPGRGALPLLSAPLLREWAGSAGFELTLSIDEFPFTWAEFVHFYSVPAIGADRIPGLDEQSRWEYLGSLPPQFEQVRFRSVVARFAHGTAHSHPAVRR